MRNAETLSTAFFLLFSAVLAAQAPTSNPGGKISGDVRDENHQPIESATITLLWAADSSRVRQTMTDRAGKFSLERLRDGKYLAFVSAVGYANAAYPVVDIDVNNRIILLKTIELKNLSKNLSDVSVVGKKPFIEQKADRMIVNVDASPSNAGSTALDVLEKSPGVTLDKDDNISLKGKQGVTLMIDNKPTYLSSSQLASYLKSLPASAIDQIELMTNPSAKYDAAGNSGIINIKTRKNKTRGFNGSVNLTHSQGVYPKPSGSINMNYRNGKYNVFLNGGYARWEGFQHLDIGRTYLDKGATRVVNSIFTQGTEIHFANPQMNLKLGMDYFLNSRTTMGFVVSGFQNKENNRTSSHILLKDANSVIDSMVNSYSVARNTWRNGSFNLNFRHQFDSTGKELTADLDYVTYNNHSDQWFQNTTTYPGKADRFDAILTGYLPSTINIYIAKADYSHPISRDFKLEAGVKSSYVRTDNMANYYNLSGTVSEVDTTKTNHFLYRENINAAYVNLNRQYKKWGIQAGLRIENTDYHGHQLGNDRSVINKDSSFSRNYFSLFPTVYLSYQASDKHQFSMNYGRRIDRPAYQDLNPFLFFLDQYTYESGNPYMQPQFSHNVELTHTYAGFLTTTLNYSYTKDIFAETFEQSGRASILKHGNIGSKQNAGIAVSAQIPVAKWWTSILYMNANYTQFDGMLYNEPIHVNATTVTMNLNNQLTFKHGWGAELSGWYRTKGVEGQIVIYSLGQATAAVSKKIMQENGSLKLSVRDCLYTNKPHGYVNFQQTEATFHNQKDSRQVSITFGYRFGKPLKAPARRRTTGARDEESRVKTGGNN